MKKFIWYRLSGEGLLRDDKSEEKLWCRKDVYRRGNVRNEN